MTGKSLAILLPNLTGGGVERMSLDLARIFKQEGCDVTFILVEARGDLLDVVESEFNIVDLKSPRIRNGYKPLRAWLKHNRPDSLLACIWPVTALAILASRGLGVKVSVSDHNPLSLQYRDRGAATKFLLRHSIKWVYPMAYRRIGVSTGVARDVEHLGGLSENSVDVIYNPVREMPPSSKTELQNAENLWRPNKGKRLISVGSFKRQKNHALMIKAVTELSKTQNVQLLLLGDGNLRPELEQLVKNCGVEDRIMLPGFVADPLPYYRTADLFVLSSNYEGFGNVIIEALACGLPVVSTDCPSGPNEILQGGEYGHLVPINDIPAMVSALERGLEDHVESAKQIARSEDFTSEKIAREYMEMLF